MPLDLGQAATIAGTALLGASGAQGRASATSLLNNRLNLAAAQKESDLKVQQLAEKAQQDRYLKSLELSRTALMSPEFRKVASPKDIQIMEGVAVQSLQGLGQPAELALGFVPETPDDLKPQLIQTVDPVTGENIQTFATPTEGATFPVQPPKPDKPEPGTLSKPGIVTFPNNTKERAAMNNRGGLVFTTGPNAGKSVPADLPFAPIPSAQETGGPGDFDNFRKTDKPQQRKDLKERDRIEDLLDKAQSAWDAFKQAPGSGGLTGAVSENIGGVLGQIPLVGESLEDSFSLLLTGGTPEENKRSRIKAQSLAAELIEPITGEESGRYTEPEQKLARNAQTQLTLSGSNAAIAEAYRVFVEIGINDRDRQNVRTGIEQRFNTNTIEGQTDYVNNLIERGFTKQQAFAAVKRRIRAERLR